MASFNLDATLLSGALLALLIGVFIFAPSTLPLYKQRMLAVASALLAGLFSYLLPGTIGITVPSFKTPFGNIHLDATGGIAVFVFVLVWWLSPLAPVGVETKRIEKKLNEIVVSLENELSFKNRQIVFLQGQVERLQTQAPSPRALELAGQIHPEANSYALALKAIAEGQFDDARRFLREAERTKEVELAKIYVAHGETEVYAGRYPVAAGWYQKALGIRQEDPDILNGTAVTLYLAGNYTEAEPLYKQSLAIREKVLGLDHPDVAASLNNLAALYQDQGRYADAEPLYKRSLAIREKVLGPDHPDVATSLDNLASLYWSQGRYADAEPLFKRALAIREKALGPDHPDVATMLESMAVLYTKLDREDEAKKLLDRAKRIRAGQ